MCKQRKPTRSDALPHLVATGLIRTWLRFKVQEITVPILTEALRIKSTHSISYRDAAIVAAARALGCRELLSEDMAHGREIEGTDHKSVPVNLFLTSRSLSPHIGGVMPSRPTETAAASRVPSSFLLAAAMKTLAPGLSSLLSPCT
jgi:hypothetical protein